MLGAPFAAMGFRDPFLPVNFICFLMFSHFFILYFRSAISTAGAAAVLALALIWPLRLYVPHTVDLPMFSQFVIPWNTNPVAMAFLAIFLVSHNMDKSRSRWRDYLIGFLAGFIVSLRFVEAVPLIIPGLFYAYWRLFKQRAFANVLVAVIGAGTALLPFTILTFLIHGDMGGEYLATSGQISLSTSDLHERAAAIFVDAGPQFNEPGIALLDLQPWLALCIPFSIYWIAANWRMAVLPVGTATMAIIVYLSYNDFSPLNIFRFGLVHYLVWTLPVLAAAGISGLVLALRSGAWKGAGLAALAGLVVGNLGVSLQPMPLSELSVSQGDVLGEVTYQMKLSRPQEIDAIDLRGASASDWAKLTLSEVALHIDDGPPLKLFRDYRMFATPEGIRLLTNSHIRGQTITLRVDDAISNPPIHGEEIAIYQVDIGLKLFQR